MQKTYAHIKGSQIRASYKDFGDEIAFNDSKIKFITNYTDNKDVLDLGCVQHNKENYQSKYWLHKAIAANAKKLVGMDLSKEGVDYLKDKGLDVVFGDAQCFDLKKQFDVIVAGDIIEHLDNIGNFLESCRRHLKSDGKLIVTTPNPWHWKFIIKSAFLGGEVPINPEHTCWLCPSSLRQIVMRYGFRVNHIEFGSRYPRDLFMPLPSGWKHTGFYSEIVLLD